MKKILSLLLLLPLLLCAQAPAEGEPFVKTFTEKDTTFQGAAGTIGATITYPLSPKSYRLPAVILIAGSGAHDRDENILGYRPFRQLAHAMASEGYIVVRTDSRGIGKSYRPDSPTLIADLIADNDSIIAFTAGLPQVDGRKITLAGHSLGGAVAAASAKKNPKNINGIVTFAAPATTGREMMVRQNEMLLNAIGSMVTPDVHQALDTIFAAVESVDAQRITDAVKTHGIKAGMNPTALMPTIQALTQPEYIDMVKHDFAADFADLNVPLCAMYFEWDIQVDPELNSAAIKRILPLSQVDMILSTNHLMQHTNTFVEAINYNQSAGREVTPDIIRTLLGFLSTLR